MPRTFEFRVIVCPTPKTIILGAHRFGGLQFSDFQFKFLPIDYNKLYSYQPFEKKNEAKRKSITFSFNFIFIVEQTVRKCPGTHYFYSFLSEILPQYPNIFYYFCRKIMPRTTLYLPETALDPTIFYFSR